jgi:hypothetical protein
MRVEHSMLQRTGARSIFVCEFDREMGKTQKITCDPARIGWASRCPAQAGELRGDPAQATRGRQRLAVSAEIAVTCRAQQAGNRFAATGVLTGEG